MKFIITRIITNASDVVTVDSEVKDTRKDAYIYFFNSNVNLMAAQDVKKFICKISTSEKGIDIEKFEYDSETFNDFSIID